MQGMKRLKKTIVPIVFGSGYSVFKNMQTVDDAVNEKIIPQTTEQEEVESEDVSIANINS